MKWRWPWSRDVETADEAVRAAEQLRDRAQDQQARVEANGPRVAAAAERLERLRTENHFGPMIENILRGTR
jgi:hypothetical protein